MLHLGKRLWRTLTTAQRRRVVLLVGAVVVMAVLEVVNVSAIAPFLSLASDPAMVEQNVVLSFLYETFGFSSVNRFLVAAGIGVFALMLLSNAWSALTIWAQLRLVWSWNHQLSVRLLRRYLYQPYSYFLSRNTAELSKNLLSEVHRVTGSMISPVILALGRTVVVIGIVAVLIVMNPVLALLVTVVVGGSYAAVYAFTRRRLNAIGGDLVKANEERFRVANEALGGIKDVKILNAEESFLERFTDPSRRFSRHEVTYAVIGALPRYAIETIAFGTVILIVVFLLAVERDFGSIVPMLGLYAFAGYRLMPSLQQVFAGITAARFYSAALEAVLSDLETHEENKVDTSSWSAASGRFERFTAAQARPSSEARTKRVAHGAEREAGIERSRLFVPKRRKTCCRQRVHDDSRQLHRRLCRGYRIGQDDVGRRHPRSPACSIGRHSGRRREAHGRQRVGVAGQHRLRSAAHLPDGLVGGREHCVWGAKGRNRHGRGSGRRSDCTNR